MKLTVLLTFVILLSLKQIENFSYDQKQYGTMMNNNFEIDTDNLEELKVIIIGIKRELHKEKLRMIEKMRKQEEENARKQQELKQIEYENNRRLILNERLMPLTRGNSFMRDFYSGRY